MGLYQEKTGEKFNKNLYERLLEKNTLLDIQSLIILLPYIFSPTKNILPQDFNLVSIAITMHDISKYNEIKTNNPILISFNNISLTYGQFLIALLLCGFEFRIETEHSNKRIIQLFVKQDLFFNPFNIEGDFFKDFIEK